MGANRSGPQVSILMPVRNAGETLPDCLDSLARQTLQDWECVAVDDGSTDRTWEILKNSAKSDPRIRPVQGEDSGLVAALNQGLARCAGRYVARMDADDLMHRQRLALQVGRLEEDRTLAGVGCRVRMFPRSGLGDGMRAYEHWLNRIGSPEQVLSEAWIECPVAHPALTIRAGLLQEAGYQDRGWPEDYDLVLRLLGDGLRLEVLSRRLLAWRRSHRSHAMTDPRYGPDRFTACKADHLCRDSAVGFLSGVSRYLLWGYGGTGRTLARELLSRGRRPSAIVELHPGRIGNRILNAPVIRPEELPPPGTVPLVVSVAGEHARTLIRDDLARRRWVEGQDFICAA